MKISWFLPLAAIFGLLLASCSDDSEFDKKREQQETEIARLQQELALIGDRLEKLSSDAAEQADSEKMLESMRKRLTDEVSVLEKERERILKEYEDYRSKYSVNSLK